MPDRSHQQLQEAAEREALRIKEAIQQIDSVNYVSAIAKPSDPHSHVIGPKARFSYSLRIGFCDFTVTVEADDPR